MTIKKATATMAPQVTRRSAEFTGSGTMSNSGVAAHMYAMATVNPASPTRPRPAHRATTPARTPSVGVCPNCRGRLDAAILHDPSLRGFVPPDPEDFLGSRPTGGQRSSRKSDSGLSGGGDSGGPTPPVQGAEPIMGLSFSHADSQYT